LQLFLTLLSQLVFSFLKQLPFATILTLLSAFSLISLFQASLELLQLLFSSIPQFFLP